MRSAAIALAVWAIPAAASAPVPTKVPLFTRTLSFTLPSGLVLANNRNNGTNVLMEYVPKGETLANWTRLVTIQAYRGLGSSPLPTAAIARQAFFTAACKIGPTYRDSGERVLANGVKRSVVTFGCASLPAGAYPKVLKGASEQDVIYVFRDAESIYTLNYAVRGAPALGSNAIIAPEVQLQQVFGNAELR